ncbi:MAG: nucleotidyltransferase domain-containing protein [Synergistaceae bacterium]|nr:nucleotidyltransferase domain-containing protein [Synergistaceae bacterium]
MRYTIDDIEERIIPVAKSYGVGSVSVFGSYARGEADEDSDIDILIDRGKLGGLIEYFSFVNELEDVLGCHVDVVTSGIENKDFLDAVSRERIKIYESH